MDAAHFLPQSRPRLFIVAVRSTLSVPAGLTADGPVAHWHPSALIVANGKLSKKGKGGLDLVASAAAACTQHAMLRPDRGDAKKCAVAYPGRNEAPAFSDEPQNSAKVEAAKRAGRRMVGGLYRRTRADDEGGQGTTR